MKDPEVEVDLTAPDVVPGVCQFCGQDMWILVSMSAVGHGLPYCAEFQAMEPVTYLQENRKLRERRTVRA